MKAPHYIGITVGDEKLLISFIDEDIDDIIVERFNKDTGVWQFYDNYAVAFRADGIVFDKFNKLVK